MKFRRAIKMKLKKDLRNFTKNDLHHCCTHKKIDVIHQAFEKNFGRENCPVLQ